MYRLLCLLIGYAAGCLQTAYIVGRVTANIDIREHGSGGAGATNVQRTIGNRAALIVFATDILKSVLAYVVCSLLFDGGGSFLSGISVLPGFYAGIGVLLGHNYPFFLKFKGGKGAASSIGLILCVDFWVAFLSYLAGFVMLISFRFVSLASLVIMSCIPIFLYLFHYSAETVCLGFVVTLLSFIQHRENIKRLMNRNERKLTFKK